MQPPATEAQLPHISRTCIPWPRASSSITCRASARPGRAARRFSRTSTFPSTPTPRSACSASTARASRRFCASWPASTPSSSARASSPKAPRSAICPQEPALDPALTVRGNAMLGVKEKQAILDRYNELAMNYSDETADEMTPSAGRDRGQGPMGSRQPGRAGDGRARLPAGRCRRRPRSRAASAAASRSAGFSSRSRSSCCSTSRPTISTPRRSTGSKAICAQYPGAILIVTHDRYFLDNVTGWILELDRGRGIPYEGNYSSWLKQKQKRLEQEGREEAARQRALAEESEWIASSPKARQAKSKARIAAYDELVRKSNEKAPTTAQIIIPVAERLGQNVIDFADLIEGLRRPAAHRQAHVQAAARRHRRRHRPQRRRQDDALSHDHRPGEAGLGDDQDRRIRRARLCRPVARRARRQEDRVGGDLRRLRPHHARQARDEQRAPMSARSTSRAPTSRRRSASSRAASATACTSPKC